MLRLFVESGMPLDEYENTYTFANWNVEITSSYCYRKISKETQAFCWNFSTSHAKKTTGGPFSVVKTGVCELKDQLRITKEEKISSDDCLSH